ncbi:MAG: hypothetical protein NTZ51_10245 [Proteobacteria bacterium]|nr:hypothetical protein [Pseudomonadota bacterium]
MASNVKQTREAQKEKFLKLLAQRKAQLLAQGVAKEKIVKDNVAKHLRAEIKRTSQAIASITARQQVIEKAKVQKQERAAQAAAEGPKAKKKAQAEKAPAKAGKKEKKEKKEKKPAEA